MSWFKVDDKLWGHPKWLATPIRSRGLWVTAGSWCADQEQDGNVPRHVLPILGATVRDASALVTVGLWVATDTGWHFHGWAEFQPTREQKEADRLAARERMRAARERKAAQRAADVRANIPEVRDVFGGSSEDVRSTPSRPVPTRTSKEVLTAAGADAPSVQDRFPEFWSRYPRKVAKQDATKAWRKQTKTTDPQVILDGLGRHQFSQDPQFIPYPASWLNAGQWEDQTLTTVTTPAPGGTWTEEQLTAVLGPDRWRAPQPPSDIPAGERWDWVQQQWLANRADRIRQAIAKQQGGVA